MGDNRLAKVVIAAAFAGGLAGLMAAPASAQSLTDRFKSGDDAERFVVNLAKAWIDANP